MSERTAFWVWWIAVPTVADVVRNSLRKEHDALKRKTAAQERRG